MNNITGNVNVNFVTIGVTGIAEQTHTAIGAFRGKLDFRCERLDTTQDSPSVRCFKVGAVGKCCVQLDATTYCCWYAGYIPFGTQVQRPKTPSSTSAV